MALTTIDDRGLKTPIDLLDSEKIRFGTGNDLQIYHDGSNSYIKEAGTGQLMIQADNLILENAAGANYLVGMSGGEVILYHNDQQKFETESTGVKVTGNAEVTGNIELPTVNTYIKGNGSNSVLQVDATRTYFYGGSDGIQVRKADNSTHIITVDDSGNTTVAGNIDIPNDSGKLRLGTSQDLEIYHDGSHSYIKNGQGSLKICDTNVELMNAAADEYMLKAIQDGAVELYYDNSKKFETTSTGSLFHTSLKGADGADILLGNSDDLQIYHDGTDSYLTSTTGELRVYSNGGILRMRAKANENAIIAVPDAEVQLYYDNVKKFWTKSDGAEVEGTLDADRVDCNGQLHVTYPNSTNTNYMSSFNNNNGNMILFRGDGIYVGDNMDTSNQAGGPNNQKIHLNTNGTVKVIDNAKFVAGTGDDLQIYHDASNSFIKNTTGAFFVASNDLRLTNSDQDEIFIKGIDDAGVELYYDNTKRFETTSKGVNVLGGGLNVNRDNSLYSAAIYFNGFSDTNHMLWNDHHNNPNSTRTTTDGFDGIKWNTYMGLQLFGKGNEAETIAKFMADGACELYQNNNKRIFTEAEGASICGDGSDCHVRLRDSADNVRGILHATASPDIGFITTDASSWIFRVESDGDYQFYGSNVSDRDRKDNITTISGTSLDKVTKLVPKTFTFKQDDTGKVPTDKVFAGFIAQEVKEHLPDIVKGTDGQKNMAVDYNGILAHAVKAITELSAEVETLKTEVAALKAK